MRVPQTDPTKTARQELPHPSLPFQAIGTGVFRKPSALKRNLEGVVRECLFENVTVEGASSIIDLLEKVVTLLDGATDQLL
jgi:hypothetical protein